MQIKYLSSSDLRSFGRILSHIPDTDALHTKTQLELNIDTQIPVYEAPESIVLDYVSGMSLLVIYQDTDTHIF